jgi:hypothetical protein
VSDDERPGRGALLGRPLVDDALVVLAWFAGLGVLSALVWWQVTPLAEYTRTASNAQMGEEQLGRQVSADGWYFAIATVAGLLSGIVLVSWRHRDPVATVILLVPGALLCAWLMLRLGLWLGPENPKEALPHVAVGAHVPLQLRIHADGLLLVWPIAALLGAIGVIWGTDTRPGSRAAKILEDPLSVERSR